MGGGGLWHTYSTCQTLRLGRFFSGRLTKVDGRVVHSLIMQLSERGSGPRGGGGGTLIFSHIRRLGLIFGVQNSEFQYFLGFSEK